MPVNCIFRMLILIFLALGVPQIYAQSWEVNLNFITGFPQNEFGDNVDNVGLGGGGGFGYHLGSNPILVGGEFSFLIYGSETQRVPVIITIPNVTVDVQTSNNIFIGHFFVRLQSNQGGLRPYLEGLIGLHNLFTETEIKNGTGNEVIAKSTNQEDYALSYGAGAGLMIRVHKTDDDIKEVFINLRGRYLFGGEADYLSFRREDGQVSIDFNNSRTDLITFQLGVAFTF